jgi:hypothetical protein
MAFVELTEGWRLRVRGVVFVADLFGIWMNRTMGAGIVLLASVLPTAIFVLGR